MSNVGTGAAIAVEPPSGATNNFAITATGKSRINAIISGTPTFSISGCSASSLTGGAAAGTFISGTTGTCTAVITIGGGGGVTAPNGWHCSASNQTAKTTLPTIASTTTTATIEGATTSGDKISLNCGGY